MVILLALASAACYALGTVLQFNAANGVDREWGLRLRLLGALARDRRFLAGVALDLAGGVGQFFALKYGRVDVVLPALACGFPVAIAIDHKWNNERMPPLEIAAIVAAAGSLAGFLATRPAGAGAAFSGSYQRLAVGTVAAIAAGVVAVGVARPFLRRVQILGSLLGGLLLGYVAILERAVGLLWAHSGIRSVVTSWELYSLLAVGGIALVVVQSSFQGSVFRRAVSVVAVLEPISAVILAAAVLGEPALGPDRALSGLLVVVAITSLAYLGYQERAERGRS